MESFQHKNTHGSGLGVIGFPALTTRESSCSRIPNVSQNQNRMENANSRSFGIGGNRETGTGKGEGKKNRLWALKK